MLEVDTHGIKYARDTFAEYSIDVSRVSDEDVVQAYNSILSSAAMMIVPADRIFTGLRNLCAPTAEELEEKRCALEETWRRNDSRSITNAIEH